MRAALAFLVGAAGLSSLAGWGASFEGVIDRRPEGSVVLYGAEAFWHVAPFCMLGLMALGVIGFLTVLILDD